MFLAGLEVEPAYFRERFVASVSIGKNGISGVVPVRHAVRSSGKEAPLIPLESREAGVKARG
jgi:hypothetical protein